MNRAHSFVRSSGRGRAWPSGTDLPAARELLETRGESVNLLVMAYTIVEARQHLLGRIADAAGRLGVALAHLGEAYEQLDEHTAERLEEELFRPAQRAYGLLKRDYAEFAARNGLPPRAFEPAHPEVRPGDAKGALASAVEAVSEADGILAELQDSMLPVEAGDAELRATLAQTRRLLGALPEQTRQIVRTLGR